MKIVYGPDQRLFILAGINPSRFKNPDVRFFTEMKQPHELLFPFELLFDYVFAKQPLISFLCNPSKIKKSETTDSISRSRSSFFSS